MMSTERPNIRASDVQIAVLEERVTNLTLILTAHVLEAKRINETQQKCLDELVALANKGKGSLWILIAIGGLLGVLVSNINTIFHWFKP